MKTSGAGATMASAEEVEMSLVTVSAEAMRDAAKKF